MTRSCSLIFSFVMHILMQIEMGAEALPAWNEWVGAIVIFGAICIMQGEDYIRFYLDK